MKQELISLLLGEISVAFFVGFYIFALFGVILSMLLHYGKKKSPKAEKFSLKFWLTDNVVRLLTCIFSIFIVVRFFDELPIDMELNMFLAVIVGVSLDQVIVLIRNKTSINLFQK